MKSENPPILREGIFVLGPFSWACYTQDFSACRSWYDLYDLPAGKIISRSPCWKLVHFTMLDPLETLNLNSRSLGAGDRNRARRLLPVAPGRRGHRRASRSADTVPA